MALTLKTHVSSIVERYLPNNQQVFDMKLVVDTDGDNMCEPGREPYCTIIVGIKSDLLPDVNVNQECTITIEPELPVA